MGGTAPPPLDVTSISSELNIVCGVAVHGRIYATQVSKRAYRKLLKCVRTADINDCEEIPSGGGKRSAKLTNPLGGTVHQVDGPDRY